MATRNTIGIFSEVWAGTGDRTEIPDFEEGFGIEYQVDEAPDRRNMNDVLAKATAVCVDVNVNGCYLPWNTGITYVVNARVLGSDSKKYKCIAQNIGNDPISSPTKWSVDIPLEEIYTLTPPVGGDLRTFDPNTANFGEIADVLATLIKDLT